MTPNKPQRFRPLTFSVIHERIRRVSDIIDLRRLERETRRLLYLGLLVAILFHAALFMTIGYHQTQPTVAQQQPIPMELIIRPPRMTRPLTINPPDVARQEFQKPFTQRTPGGNPAFHSYLSIDDAFRIVDALPVKIDSVAVLSALARIDADYRELIRERFGEEMFLSLEPLFDAPISREDERVISLVEQMITVEYLDTGQFMGVVVQDPEDRQAIKGVLHIPVDIWGSTPNTTNNTLTLRPAGAVLNAVPNLVYGFIKHTGIQLVADGHLQLTSPTLTEYPFIYISSDQLFDTTPQQVENLGKFLANGGFLIAEGYNPPGDTLDTYPQKGLPPLRQLILDALGEHGDIYPIATDHPLFHTFYDIPVNDQLIPFLDDGGFERRMPFINGIWYDGRLVGVLSDYEWGSVWATDPNSSAAVSPFETPDFRIGVNMIVYSLIREGSPAQQYIDAGQ